MLLADFGCSERKGEGMARQTGGERREGRKEGRREGGRKREREGGKG